MFVIDGKDFEMDNAEWMFKEKNIDMSQKSQGMSQINFQVNEDVLGPQLQVEVDTIALASQELQHPKHNKFGFNSKKVFGQK